MLQALIGGMQQQAPAAGANVAVNDLRHSARAIEGIDEPAEKEAHVRLERST
jgi:hypothetical protein